MRAQGLPVNMIVLTALALLVLVVVGAFFISGFSGAAQSVDVVEASQAECQSICQSLTTMAFNYNVCSELQETNRAQCYAGISGTTSSGEDCFDVDCAGNYGRCTVTLRGGAQCQIG